MGAHSGAPSPARCCVCVLFAWQHTLLACAPHQTNVYHAITIGWRASARHDGLYRATTIRWGAAIGGHTCWLLLLLLPMAVRCIRLMHLCHRCTYLLLPFECFSNM